MKSWPPEYTITQDPSHIPFIREAYRYGFENADDESSKNGAVLVHNGEIVCYGTNGFLPRVEKTPGRMERPLKYSFVRHAERDVIYNAAREGIATESLTMYCPWYACADCAIAIASSGITAVIGHEDTFLRTPERWQGTILTAMEILQESGVETLVYRGEIGGVQSMLNGEVWNP